MQRAPAYQPSDVCFVQKYCGSSGGVWRWVWCNGIGWRFVYEALGRTHQRPQRTWRVSPIKVLTRYSHFPGPSSRLLSPHYAGTLIYGLWTRVVRMDLVNVNALRIVYTIFVTYECPACIVTIRYDTIRDARPILTCALKPTWVSLLNLPHKQCDALPPDVSL